MSTPHGRITLRIPRALGRFLALSALLVAGACNSLHDPNVPEPIQAFVEPEYGGPYEFYRPSSYDRRQRWPLIVVCHGGYPDSPNRQIRAWNQLAERTGFLVVAPKLAGAARAANRQSNEQRILATIRHVRAGHSVSEDRVFLYGYGAGAQSALYTGLRHPDLFRAVAVIQPKFNEAFMADTRPRLDPQQPVLVHYGLDDFLIGRHGARSADWLRTQGFDPREDSSGPARPTDTERVVEFFELIVRNVPWLAIQSYPAEGGDPLAVYFRLRTSVQPKRVSWSFGDGGTATGPEVTHVFARPGAHDVRLTVEDERGTVHRRAIRVAVPGGEQMPLTTEDPSP